MHRLAATKVSVKVGNAATANARLVKVGRVTGEPRTAAGTPAEGSAQAYNEVSGDIGGPTRRPSPT